MVRSPHSHRPRIAPLLAIAAFATIAAGCSDSKPSALVPTTTAAPTTVAVTDSVAPETSAAADTTAATTPATDPPAASVDLRGKWLLMEKVTEKKGDYLNDAVPVLSRYYNITCDNVACDGGTIVVSGPGGDSFGDEYDMTFMFDGTKLFTQGSRTTECLDPTTGETTDLKNSTVNTNVELDLNGAATGFTGKITVNLVTEASAQCKGEDIGFTADLSMTKAAASPVGPTPSIFVGSDTNNEGLQRGVLHCDSGCDYKLRMNLEDSTAEGPKLHEQIEFLLTDQKDGTYTGTAHYKESCLSDDDGNFIAAAAYDVTHSVRVGWQLSADGNPILVTIEKVVGEPDPALPVEQRALCSSFTIETSFAGYPLDDAAPLLIDWGVPVANTN